MLRVLIIAKNYTGDDDEEMAKADEEDEEELNDESIKTISDDLVHWHASRYTRDEDTSYKIRCAATKLLAAVIVTRPKLLTPLYKEVSPVLISWFSDHEQTVHLEVWATYVALLNQTSTYGGLPQISLDGENIMCGKCKCDSKERMDVEETPYILLKSQIPCQKQYLPS